jgi:hypothetical protein
MMPAEWVLGHTHMCPMHACYAGGITHVHARMRQMHACRNLVTIRHGPDEPLSRQRIQEAQMALSQYSASTK